MIRARLPLLVVSALCAGLFARPVAAQLLPDADVSAGLRAGTLGVGPELEVRWHDAPFGVRLGMDGLGFDGHDMLSHHVLVDSPPYGMDARLAYDVRMRLLTGGLTADWYVLGDLRVSAGLLVNGDRAESQMRARGTVQVGPYSFPVNQVVNADGTATWNALAPFLGLGYETPVFRQASGGALHLSIDLGAFYEGHPHSSVTVSGPGSTSPLVQSVMDSERRRVTNAIDLPFYPVAMVGLSWRF